MLKRDGAHLSTLQFKEVFKKNFFFLNLCQRYEKVIFYLCWEVKEQKGSSLGQVLLGVLENPSGVEVLESLAWWFQESLSSQGGGSRIQ